MIPMIQVIKDKVLLDIAGRRDRQKLYQGDPELTERVRTIIDDVARRGLPALLSHIQAFDSPVIKVQNLWVTPQEIDAAHAALAPESLMALRLAIKFISEYHAKQVPQGWQHDVLSGSLVGLRYQPLDRVGVYVPGGRAAYPSSVLMNVIPARMAGVPEVVVATPAGKDGKVHPLVLAAAKEVGVTRVLKAGGAQAVAALAFGFEGFAPVDKVVGPGNAYVTEAKRQVYGVVAIDKLAGPTDLTIVADHSARAPRVAAELIAQAEHDPDSEVFLITPYAPLVPAVLTEIMRQLKDLPRKEIVEKALGHSAFYEVASLAQAYDAVNALAPEHLVLMTERPKDAMFHIRHAGAIFLGHDSPVALGDYMIGPNHVLPTMGTARYAGPLGVADFLKTSSFTQMSKEDLKMLANDVALLARLEGLEGHARSLNIPG